MTDSTIHFLKREGGIGNTRTLKKQTILRLLCDGDLSCSDLAKYLDLSNSGVTGIVDELEEEKLVVRRDSEQTFKGRRPVMVSIDRENWMVATVMLTSRSLINIGDTAGHILARYEHEPYAKVSRSDLNFIVAKLREMLAGEACGGRRLIAVSIAAPGKINYRTGAFAYAPFLEDYERINLKETFESEFGVPVVIRNMLQFAFIGEKRYGALAEEIQDTLYVSSLGSALCLNGQLYDGHNGFAGELGLITIDVNNEINDYFNKFKHNILASACSSERLNKVIAAELQQGGASVLREAYERDGAIGNEAIAAAFREGDPLCVRYVSMHAKILSCVIRNIAEYLDLNSVILAGVNASFGERYRAIVQEELAKTYSYVDTKVYLASLDADAAETKGAFYCAVGAGLAGLIR